MRPRRVGVPEGSRYPALYFLTTAKSGKIVVSSLFEATTGQSSGCLIRIDYDDSSGKEALSILPK
jgi:hypothetical protein